MTKTCQGPKGSALKDLRTQLGRGTLIIDEDEARRTRRASYLYRRGHDVVSIADPLQVSQLIDHDDVEMVVLSEQWSQDAAWIARKLGLHSSFVMVVGFPSSILVRQVDCNRRTEMDDLESLDAVIRAHRAKAPPRHGVGDGYEFAGWRLFAETFELISPEGKPVVLQRAGFNTLRALAARPGHVLSRSQLLRVSQVDRDTHPRCVDFRIASLRRQLRQASSQAIELIKTVRGEGYVLDAPVRRWSGA